ncbi:MAG TPA: hypothetical protein VKZ61_08785 [Thermomicrobiales bacterium]|nr:hypothetical protein [Thermomicrobiales bacterium]
MFTTGQLVVIGLRLVVPLLILKRPLAGGIIAMLLDALDVVIVEWFGPGGMGDHYHSIDKVLDLYYLGLEAWVALSWTERLPRLTAISLFVYRVAGVIVFELTNWRPALFLFPNLFEHWFLFVLVRNKWFPNMRLDSWGRIALWLVILYIPKLGQEYLLHVAEAQPWDWIKSTFGL